jgi:hypothetical protein
MSPILGSRGFGRWTVAAIGGAGPWWFGVRTWNVSQAYNYHSHWTTPDDAGNLYTSEVYQDTITYVEQPHIIKMTNAGGLVFTRKLTGSSWSQQVHGLFHKNGGLYFSGVNGTSSNQWNYVLKTNDSTGAVITDARVQYDTIASESNFGATADPSDNLYIKGSFYNFSTSSRVGRIASVTSALVKRWTKGTFYDVVGGMIYFANNILYISWNSAIVKTDSSGAILVAKYLESSSYQWSWGVDASDNVYVRGINAISKYNNFLNGVWKISISGAPTGGDYDLHTVLDASNNVYAIRAASGSKQAIIIKISPSGTVLWQRSIAVTRDGSALSLSNNQKNVSLSVMANGDIAISVSLNPAPRFPTVYLKVPADGTKTGTYTNVNGGNTYAITYASESYTTTSSTPTGSNFTEGWYDFISQTSVSTGSPSYVTNNITDLTNTSIV